ncbi:MAG TPA: cupin domain-containing protein [Myxococcota bacterium]|nr:cupin domain-containing protein [Myxococcota bacterium]
MTFRPLALEHGDLLTTADARVRCQRGAALDLGPGAHWGMVADGEARVEHAGLTFPLRRGMFFVAPGEARLSGAGATLVLTTATAGPLQIGQIEPVGRLRYIDGCTDTLLVCPPRLGEACLNHLHIPARTDQSAHTHPSDRLGVIVGGYGRCRTPGASFDLTPGMGWWIPAGTEHAFATDDQALDVLAWHPDSDFGPTDHDHPMLNRTFRVK